MSNSTPERPFWIKSPVTVAGSIHRLELEEQSALFCERKQQLFQLNPTAALIWDQLVQGAACQSIVERFAAEGLASSDAFDFIVGMVETWFAAGHAAPADVIGATFNAPLQTRYLSVGPVNFRIRFFGDTLPSFDAVFGHLETTSTQPYHRLDVVQRSHAYFLVSDGQPLGMTGPSQVCPFLKAWLTEACCNATEEGFLAHGALVSRNHRRVLITGSPGAGKTTLTMALVASGFSFCSDDIVHIHPDGQATGLPFAAAVKAGSWELLSASCPGLSAAAVHERMDGQRVRYVVPPDRDSLGRSQIDAVVVLSRDSARPAVAEPLTPLDTLCEILKSGYSPQRRIEARTLRALAERLCAAARVRLVYSELPDAVAAIAALP